MIFWKMYYISAGQTSLLSSVRRDEYFILIIRQLTSLASSASVMQISGGSTPLAKERAQFCFSYLPCRLFFLVRFFLTQRALRASPLYPPLQMDKYIYLINQARGPYWENIGPRSWQYGPSAARSVQKRPRADILPVRSRASLVNKRFIIRLKKALKVFHKCGIIRDNARSNT